MKTAADGAWTKDDAKKLFCWRLKVGKTSIVRKAKTLKALKVKVAAALVELNERGAPQTKVERDMTAGAWLDFWLASFVKPNKQHNTWRNYEQATRNYLKPRIGHIKLNKLSSTDCQTAINAMEVAGLSPSTRTNARVVLRRALNVAMKQTPPLLLRNPVEGTEPPKRSIARKRVVPGEQFDTLIAECLRQKPVTNRQRRTEMRYAHHYGPLFAFGLATGMRVSEYSGQAWEDVDLCAEPRPIAFVRRKLIWKNGGLWEIDATKSEKGERSIPLADVAVSALKAQRSIQATDAAGKGDAYRDFGLVWTTEAGTPVKPRNLQRALNDILAAANLPHYSLKDLRKAFGTHLARQRVAPHVLQALMGHESIETTMGHYVLAFGGDMDDAMNAFAAFGKSPKGPVDDDQKQA